MEYEKDAVDLCDMFLYNTLFNEDKSREKSIEVLIKYVYLKKFNCLAGCFP